MSLSAHFPTAHKLALQVEQLLQQLHSDEKDDSLPGRIESDLRDLSIRVQDLEGLVYREPNDRRAMWSTRVRNLSAQCLALQSDYEKYVHTTNRRLREQEVRERLFEGRSADGTRASTIDAYIKEGESLDRSRRNVSDLNDMGTNVLKNLREQRERLKSAQRKAFDVLNSLGMSDTVMRLIGRREHGDKLLVYGCMLVTTIILGLLYYYFIRPRG